MKPATRVMLTFLCVLLLAGGTIFIVLSWRRLQGSDDAELVGWCVMLGLGLSAAAAFVAESVFFPKPPDPGEQLRFVVLHHEGIDDPHFDLMLETAPGSPLATWRSPIWPITAPTALEQLANHRREYLEYEGEISGNRGRVSRIAAGTYKISHQPDGAKLIRWNSPSVPPLILKKEDQSRWSARPSY
jgi:hypothetical protein